MLRETEIDPFFMTENGNIAYISTDFGHKKQCRKRNYHFKGKSENGNCQFKCHGYRKL